MSASRETMSIWLYLNPFKRYWSLKSFFRRRLWAHPEFIQDSFLTPWNRLLGCTVFGHRGVKDVSDLNDGTEMVCFHCYRRIIKLYLKEES